MSPSSVYLDCNATAPVLPSVKEAMTSAFELTGNPSSVHTAGRTARAAIEDARMLVASLAGCRPRDVFFTSGGTEANNQVLRSFEQDPSIERLYISAVEHDSITAVADTFQKPVTIIPCDANGAVSLAFLKDQLAEQEGRAAISVMLANNETGLIQPIDEIADLALEHDALFHCDAVQALGKWPFSFAESGVHMMTVSAHKFGGPKGVGALILRSGQDIAPLFLGGGQESRKRSGTENVQGIVGFGQAAKTAQSDSDWPAVWRSLSELLIAQIEQAEEAVIIGSEASRLSNTLCIALPGVKAETQVMTLDLAGYCVSAGSACSSGKVQSSHVLEVMGYERDVAEGSIRVSFGWQTTRQEVLGFAEAWMEMRNRLSPQVKSKGAQSNEAVA